MQKVVDRLAREFRVEARVGRPAIAYLETLTRSSEGRAKYVTHAQPNREFAYVALRLHPCAPASGYTFDDTTIGGAVPHRIASIDSGIRDAMARGVPSGHPIVDVRVELYDGAYHDTDSTDAAFKAAAEMAFLDAAKKAQPVVLEPVMQVVVTVDDGHVNAVLNDLLARRDEVHARTHEADREVVVARVPLSELFGSRRSYGLTCTHAVRLPSSSPVTNPSCRAQAMTMSTAWGLGCHAGHRRTFAPLRRRFRSQTTAPRAPDQSGDLWCK